MLIIILLQFFSLALAIVAGVINKRNLEICLIFLALAIGFLALSLLIPIISKL